MQIPHLTQPERSKFYPVVLAAIKAHGPLTRGQRIACQLPSPGGYGGNPVLDISDSPEFETDWQSHDGVDWSRFPARIRAAATAIRDSGHYGRFHATHQDGVLAFTALELA